MTHRLALLLVATGTLSGCIAVVPYEPRGALVAEQGLEKTTRDLRAVIFRAVAPTITSVDIVDDTIVIFSRQSHIGMFYQVVTYEVRDDLNLPSIERFEIYENNNVFVYRHGGQVRYKILFTSQDDARLFVDLMWSLKIATAG